MSNPFYNASGAPVTSSQGYSATIRAEFASIAAGFALLPAALTPNKAVIINAGGSAMTLSTGSLALTGSLTVSNNMTLTSTNGATIAFGAGGTVLYSGGAYVASLTGTANEITVSASTGAVTLSLPTALTFTGKTVTGGTFASPTLSGTVAGAVTFSGALTLSAALTYGGVTLSNAVTGTGKMMLDTSPTIGGHPTIEGVTSTGATGTGNLVFSGSPTLSGTVGGALTFSGALTMSSALIYGGVTLSNAVTGTGKMVLDTSPTISNPVVGTQTAGDNSTKAASTAFVQTSIASFSNNNMIINGLIAVDQRNAGASQTFTAAGAIAYCVDRFYASCTGANVTGQQTTLSGSAYSQGYKLTGAASVTGVLFGQRIESKNVPKAAVSNNVTFQAELASDSLTTVTWNAYYANSADTFSSKTQIATGSITINSTPTIYPITFNAGANAANGICIEITGGALLATHYLWNSGWKLEPGPIATPVIPDDYSIALQKCFRYFQKFGGDGSTQNYGSGWADLTTEVIGLIPLKAEMRTAPSASFNSVSIADFVNTPLVPSGITLNGANFSSKNNVTLAAAVTGATQLRNYAFQAASSTSSFMKFSAEL